MITHHHHIFPHQPFGFLFFFFQEKKIAIMDGPFSYKNHGKCFTLFSK